MIKPWFKITLRKNYFHGPLNSAKARRKRRRWLKTCNEIVYKSLTDPRPQTKNS